MSHKNRLIGGYPIELFVERVHVEKYYICPICLSPVRDPVQCKQGHLFCADCIKRAITSNPKCPCDNLELLTVDGLSYSLVTKNIMNSLEVICIECDPNSPGKSTQCDWTGLLSEREDHLKICEYVAETCPYEGCSVKCMRKEFDQHKHACEFRITGCPFKGCDKRMNFHTFLVHKENCFFRAVLCDCEMMIDTLDMPEHKLKVCQTQVIPCPVPTECSCEGYAFARWEGNMGCFPYHNRAVVAMKRKSDLFMLLKNTVSFSIESIADTKRNLVGTYDPISREIAYGLPVYKKRGAEKWLQCSASLSNWMVQTKDSRHTMAGRASSPKFSNMYEFKLPHEMTGKWWINVSNEGWVEIDVKFTTLLTSPQICLTCRRL